MKRYVRFGSLFQSESSVVIGKASEVVKGRTLSERGSACAPGARHGVGCLSLTARVPAVTRQLAGSASPAFGESRAPPGAG